MSTVVAMKGPTDMFATMWAVKMLNFLGLSDIILQCDPEPSLIKWAESVKSKRTERTVIGSSPRRSHQSNGGVENYQKQQQGQVRNNVGSNARTHTIQTICRQRTEEMDCSTCSVAPCLVSEAVMRSPHSIEPWADRIVENSWSLEKQFLHIFQRSERDLEIQHQEWADRWKSGVWLGKSDLTDEHRPNR